MMRDKVAMRPQSDDGFPPFHTFIKRLSFSGVSRNSVRFLSQIKTPKLLTKVIHRTHVGEILRSIASPAAPENLWYARLRIPEWEQLLDESFELHYFNQVLYGNVVEKPEKDYPLEYRNIAVPSTNLEDYQVILTTGTRAGERLNFTLEFSQGAFTTREQIIYDERFEVQQHGNFFYALRGNTKNPKKIIFSFPGLGMSAGRIVYPVSAMKNLSEDDLDSVLMVVFQDRYLVPGSYMLLDTWGNSLFQDISALIRRFMEKYEISEANTMFFGASKGASIAIYYAQEFPQTHLLISTPQLHLPTYFTKPALRSNLYLQTGYWEIPEAGQLLNRYISEGRLINLFYTNNDELSNQSFIEFDQEGQNFTKYRLPGVHTAVARLGLPTMLGIIRQFIGEETISSKKRVEAEVISAELIDKQLVKLKLSLHGNLNYDSCNWYLEKKYGSTRQRYLIDLNTEGTELYTSAEEWFNLAVDDLNANWSICAVDSSGAEVYGAIANWEKVLAVCSNQNSASQRLYDAQILDLNATKPTNYLILNRYKLFKFTYRVISGNSTATAIRIVFTDDIQIALPASLSNYGEWRKTVIVATNSDEGSDIFAMRMLAREGVNELAVVTISDDEDFNSALEQRFNDLDWKYVHFTCEK